MIKIQHSASILIDEIYRYTKSSHSEEYSKTYIGGLFTSFNGVSDSQTKSFPISADFDVHGFYYRYENHYVYWKYLRSGDIGIVTIIHKHANQLKPFV
jgi:plasmid stabilization system protein ParE